MQPVMIRSVTLAKNRKQSLAIAFCAAACAANLSLQRALADQIWAQFYDGFGANNQPYALAVDSVGNLLVTGSSANASGNDDIYTVKYDAATGQVLWSVRYDGPFGGDDRGTGVAVDGQNNVVVTGYSYDPAAITGNANNPAFVFYTAKYAAGTGSLLWERRGPGTPCMPGCMEFNYQVKKVAVDGAGNVAITGSAIDPLNGWRAFYTARYSGVDGSIIWEKYYVGPGFPGPDADRPIGLAVDTAGNVIVTGSSPCCPTYTGHKDLYTVKYAESDGSVIWDRRYDFGTGVDSYARDVAVDKGGNVIISGANAANVYYTAKYSAAEGAILWEQLRPVPNIDAGSGTISAQRLVVDSAGNAIVAMANSDGSPTASPIINNLVKYAATDGHVIWTRLFDRDNCNVAYPQRLALDSADNLIARSDASQPWAVTAKYDPNGNLLWRETLNVGGGYSGGLAVDLVGNVLISISSQTGNLNLDYATVKYSASAAAPPSSFSSITCPGNIITGNDPGLCSAVVNYSAPASGGCGSTLPVTGSPPSGSAFSVGTTVVTCTASDGTSCNFTVTVNDTQAPSITCPANVSIGCSVNALAPAAFAATATDNCDPNPTITYSIQPGSGFPIGITPVTCTATDSSGNQSSCTFNVTRAPLGFTGFLSPVGGADATGGSFSSPLRTFKLNSTIPVKFTSDCGGSPVLSGVHRLEVIQYTSQTNADPPIDATPTDAATTGDEFKLNGSQWEFNLDTKATGMTAGIWLLQATLSDGSQHSVWIQLK